MKTSESEECAERTLAIQHSRMEMESGLLIGGGTGGGGVSMIEARPRGSRSRSRAASAQRPGTNQKESSATPVLMIAETPVVAQS